MTRRAPDWHTFARDVMPHLSPLLGPWLDELQGRGAPPPTVRWVIVCEGGELDGQVTAVRPVGQATRYRTARGAADTVQAFERMRQHYASLPRDAYAYARLSPTITQTTRAGREAERIGAIIASARVVPELQIMGAG